MLKKFSIKLLVESLATNFTQLNISFFIFYLCMFSNSNSKFFIDFCRKISKSTLSDANATSKWISFTMDCVIHVSRSRVICVILGVYIIVLQCSGKQQENTRNYLFNTCTHRSKNNVWWSIDTHLIPHQMSFKVVRKLI